MLIETFSQLLKPYQKRFESELPRYIEELGSKTSLRDACEYALLNGGKRFRPSLVMMIADALGNGTNVIQAALAVEYFHTASLIADDLPCMDNDDERRQKPSLHKVYGESTALLATYALISAGYDYLVKNADAIRKVGYVFSHGSDRLAVLAVENVSKNTGILGAAGGQFLDLTPPDLTPDTLLEVLRKKTVTLFEISFVLGWLFGGGEVDKLPLVKKAAEHFGMAFQIADDIDDRQQDGINGRSINLANFCGLEFAQKMFHEETTRFYTTVASLGLNFDLQFASQK